MTRKSTLFTLVFALFAFVQGAWATSLSSLDGSGTADEPYLIKNLSDWNTFANLVNQEDHFFENEYVKVTAQIDNITEMVGFSSVHSFQGTFDGGGHYLTFNIESEHDYAAPFWFVRNATIKNVKVASYKDGNFAKPFRVGKHGSALVGWAGGETLIDSVYVGNYTEITSSLSSDRYLGGIVGYGQEGSELTLKNILFEGNFVRGDHDADYVGGLVGWTKGMTLNLENCFFRGKFFIPASATFHPIALRETNAPMDGYSTNTYFYVGNNPYLGPNAVDDANIAAKAVRVQNNPPEDGAAYGTATIPICQLNYSHNCTGYYYNDAPQGLSIDYDKERGDQGYYYVNLSENSSKLVLGDDVTSFNVYDDGGKWGGRSADVEGGETLELIAPAGKVFDVGVTVLDLNKEEDCLTISDENGGKVFFEYGCDEEAGEKTKTGSLLSNRMNIYTDTYDDGLRAGFKVALTLRSGTGSIQTGAISINADHSVATIDGNYKGTEVANIPNEIDVGSVVLNRTFTKDAFSTIVLPFSIARSNVQGATFYILNGFDKVENTWKNAEAKALEVNGDSLYANIPYLVKTSGETITFTGAVKLKTAENPVRAIDSWEFRGTYGYVDFGDSAGTILGKAYGFTAKEANGYSVGAFAKAGKGAWIPPMRAYLVYNDGNSNAKDAGGLGLGSAAALPDVIEVKIMDKQGKVTETVVLNPATGAISKDRWFDIQGRQLKAKPTIKGRYLHNGKIEVVK